MFLHIGDNNLIKIKDIIGVFNSEIFANDSSLQQKCNDDKDDIYKTVIITDNKNYFTNISVATINKRIKSENNCD